MRNNNKTIQNGSKSATRLPLIDLNTPALQAHLEKGWEVLRKAKASMQNLSKS